MTSATLDLPTVISIDPPGAREIDDAISVSRTPLGGWLVDICLPDVPRILKIGTPDDLAARTAGLSRYLTNGRVERMLPRRIVDQLSLSHEEDRPMIHIRVDLDRNLSTRMRFLRRINHRTLAGMTYADADRALLDAAHPLHGRLSAIWELAAVLHEERAAATGAKFDLSRSRYTNEEGKTVRLDRHSAHRSTMAVMEIMILTNAALAAWAEEYGSPVLYRNHRLAGFAHGSRTAATLELAEQEGLDLATAALRLRSKAHEVVPAEMGVRPLGHYGLDLGAYAWFTSPLRRYCDVVNLRALLNEETECDLSQLASDLTTAHRIEKAKSSEHHARAARRAIVELLNANDSQGIAAYDLHTILRALGEARSFNRDAAMRHLLARMEEDALSGRDLATLSEDGLTLFGREAHELVTSWIDASASRRILMAEFYGTGAPLERADGHNHKSRLYDHAAVAGATVCFGRAARSGPPHNPVFTVIASWEDRGVLTTAEGLERTVKSAQQVAARHLLGKLKLTAAGAPVTPSHACAQRPSTGSSPNIGHRSAKSLLMECVQARTGSTVQFGDTVASGPPHDLRFSVTAFYRHGDIEVHATGVGRTKKDAAHDASAKILKDLRAYAD
ncbi:RNB domain-containing ribonuclease [Sphingomonas sp. 3-13AW]|uniref:RNB domain-containing ribonuclease n=1 Tax=Sphingomonas sp. 3-13AW TaxID=3050450 RepID=UPI003BB4CF21